MSSSAGGGAPSAGAWAAPDPPAPFSRNVSEHSRWVWTRAVGEQQQQPGAVEAALEMLSIAFHMGVVNLHEKSALKDVLLAEGAEAAVHRLRAMPGASKVAAELRRRAGERRRAAKEGRASASASAAAPPQPPASQAPAPAPPADTAAPPPNTADPEPSSSILSALPSSGSRCHVLSSGYVLRMTTREHALLAHGLRACDVTDASPRHFPVVVCEVRVPSPRKAQSQLHDGTRLVLETPNAGGNSIQSEAVSFEMLHHLLGADNVIPETRVEYWTSHTSIADYVCDVVGRRVAVSVTRALAKCWPGPRPFAVEDAHALLRKKALALDRARANVEPVHLWSSQLLHVWVQTREVAEVVARAASTFTFETSLVLLLTLCPELDHVVFGNRDEFAVPNPLGYVEDRERVKAEERERFKELVHRRAAEEAKLRAARERLAAATAPPVAGFPTSASAPSHAAVPAPPATPPSAAGASAPWGSGAPLPPPHAGRGLMGPAAAAAAAAAAAPASPGARRAFALDELLADSAQRRARGGAKGGGGGVGGSKASPHHAKRWGGGAPPG